MRRERFQWGVFFMLAKFSRLVKKVTRGATVFERDQNRLRYALSAGHMIIYKAQAQYRAVHKVIRLFLRETKWRALLKVRFAQLYKTVTKVQ